MSFASVERIDVVHASDPIAHAVGHEFKNNYNNGVSSASKSASNAGLLSINSNGLQIG